MRSVEVTAKTREEAIEQALGQLSVGRDEIDVEILQEGSGGLFGFGARQWQLRVSTEAAEPAGKAGAGGGRNRGRRGGHKSDGDEPRGEAKPRQPKRESREQTSREDKPKQNRGRREGGGRGDRGDRGERGARGERSDRGDRERKRPEKRTEKPSRAPQTSGEAEVAAAAASGPRRSTEASDTEAAALLQQMIELMGIEASVAHAEDEDNNLRLTVSSEDSALLIGRKGRGLAALQYVINRVAREIEGRDETERIIVDVEGYLDRRKQSLEDMALRMADRVKETGRRFRMRPMNPQERRVVHVALQEDDEIRTFSVGDTAIRSVVIAPKDEEREERPRRRGGRGRGPRRDESVAQDEPMYDDDLADAHDNGDPAYDDSPEPAAIAKPVEAENEPAAVAKPVDAEDEPAGSNGETSEAEQAPKKRRRTTSYRRTRR
jgi:spoIIIJ-associated protein